MSVIFAFFAFFISIQENKLCEIVPVKFSSRDVTTFAPHVCAQPIISRRGVKKEVM